MGSNRGGLLLSMRENPGGRIMKIAIGMVAAVLLAGLACAQTAQAQSTPQGSYLRSCAGAHVEGGALVARCQRDDGRENRSILADVGGFRGGTAHVHRRLGCREHGGPPPAPRSPTPPPPPGAS